MSYPDHVEDFRLNERYRRESEAYSKAMAKRADKRMLLVIILAAAVFISFLLLCFAPSMAAKPPPGPSIRDLVERMAGLPDNGVRYNGGITIDGKSIDIVYDKKAGIITLTELK